ncbi:MAG: cofactor-independent phosphoglycerate mutase [Firmicutes bacterium]|nr:cofactor-independent phosphoglycerate mutase [Bacillota bacterium]
MKYIVIVGDGMADYPVEQLGGKTPLEKARKPAMDRLAQNGILGLVRTVPEGMAPGSDTANLSVFGYDPRRYYSGRSPFEAAGMGLPLRPGDVSFRCNLVTLSTEASYAARTMVDYCAGEISSAEAEQLIAAVNEHLSTPEIKFYPGISYRHLAVWAGGPGPEAWRLTPPHDITGRAIAPYLPAGEQAAVFRRMMEESAVFLPAHPVNRKRVAAGLNPANSIWLWGEGTAPQLPRFSDKYGLSGSVISAVDLVRGIAVYAGLQPVVVEGATGNWQTNYAGKVAAALKALRQDGDFVYIHLEGPDECSHRHEIENKVKAIELIDAEVLRPLQAALEAEGEEYSILVLPDHATPLALRTHTGDPVPFVLFRSGGRREQLQRSFDEKNAHETGIFIAEGHRLMDYFLGDQDCI